MSDVDRDIETLSTENSYLRARVEGLEALLEEAYQSLAAFEVTESQRGYVQSAGKIDELRKRIRSGLTEDT